MLDLLLIFVLLGVFIIGFQRGVVVQSMRMVGFLIALIIARIYYVKLSKLFVLWIPYPNVQAHELVKWAPATLDFDVTFYRALAFLIIFIVSYLLILVVLAVFDIVRYFPLAPFYTRWIAAGLSFIEIYFVIFIIVSVLSLLPIESIQTSLSHSLFGKMMVEHTPIVSKLMQNWWFTYTQS